MQHVEGEYRPIRPCGDCVATLMTAPAVFVDARAEVSAAEQVARSRASQWLMVMDEGVLVSVVSVADLAAADADLAVGSIGSAALMLVYADDPLSGVIDEMLDRGVACAPVLDEHGAVTGIVTRESLRRAGLLPGERGLDLCGACGSDEHLETPCSDRGRAFCVDCSSPIPSSTGVASAYGTLGGSG